MASDENLPGPNVRAMSSLSEAGEPVGSHAVSDSSNMRNSSNNNNNNSSSSSSNNNSSAKPARSSSSSTTPTPAPLRKTSASNLVLSPAAGLSPRTSRNTSPVRKDKPPPLSGPLSTQPSAAAIQRALSASNAAQLQPANTTPDALSRLSRGPKNGSVSGDSSPQWPMSPRMKSPPPSSAAPRKVSTPASTTTSTSPSTSTLKRSESGDAPAISVQSATPQSGASVSPPAKPGSAEGPKPEPKPHVPAPLPKGPSRGPGGKSTLETVQENSADSLTEPSPAAIRAAADLHPLTRSSDDDMAKPKHDRIRGDLDKHSQAAESGSESAGNKSDHRRGRKPSASNSTSAATAQRPKQANPKNNYANLTSAKARQGDGKQNMTVETETVQSIPQSALTTSDRHDNTGSVRLKASNETIRPRKERKKTERKARSVNQGTAPSKADLFEARVASAVDEANDSDSDETFVYESNPPEPQRRQRHHSRTPSVTSSHSTAEQPRGSIRHYGDGHDERRVGGKRSMKFSSIYNDVESPESKDGTVRSHTPRHIGRYGRGGHHAASNEPDSPFTKMRNNHLSVQRPSRPTSPHSPPAAPYRPNALFGRKQEHSFDLDAEGADDERTPLMGSNRSHRHMRNLYMRRMAGGPPAYTSEQHAPMDRRSGWCSGRAGACLLILILALLVMVSAFGFVFSSNRPLYDVKIRRIQNVFATEQDLIFDLVVSAVNPNALSITASDLDVEIYAKSKHISRHKDDGTQTPARATRRLRRHDFPAADVPYNLNPSQDLSGHWHAPEPAGHDHGTDPDPGLEKDAIMIHLGNVSHFGQVLSFEASPIKRQAHLTVGSLDLKRPGNNTDESSEAEHWAAMLEYPFELITRGILRYQLPISARWQTAELSSVVTVHPEEGLSHEGHMRLEPVDESERWHWIEWPDDAYQDDLDDDTTKEATRA